MAEDFNPFLRSEARDMVHTGALNVPIGGRTDHVPVSVPPGSYVLPADVVSGLGHGNSLAGMRNLDAMLGKGPYGTSMPHLGRGSGPPRIQHHVTARADGGETPGHGEPVPVILAGGEYVVGPEDVAHHFGDGDLDRGHGVLDEFVKHIREKTIKTLKNLPGPRKD